MFSMVTEHDLQKRKIQEEIEQLESQLRKTEAQATQLARHKATAVERSSPSL